MQQSVKYGGSVVAQILTNSGIGRMQMEARCWQIEWLSSADNGDYGSVVQGSFSESPRGRTERRDKLKFLSAQLKTWVETQKALKQL